MTFKLSNYCPATVDTIVRYIQYDGPVSFSDTSVLKAFKLTLVENQFDFAKGDVKSYLIKMENKFVNLIFAALDFSSDNLLDDFRKITLELGKALNDCKAKIIYVEGLLTSPKALKLAFQFSSTLPLCDYAFDKYKQTKADFTKKEITLFTQDNNIDSLTSALNEGMHIAKSICIARDLVNEPSDVLTPYELANRCVSYGKKYGFEVDVFDREVCEKLGMSAFLTVSRGSAYEPNLIVMRYLGNVNFDTPTLGVIGKGLCYDSGGLYLKPGASMEHSKADMAGGAAVIGAMCALAANQVPVNVTAVVAACENMLDGKGYRNGDIVHTMAGKSVFVGSTDAEGRLTLADAITYMVRHENVDSIIELSTLTGSCANFFGDVCCGVLTTDDKLYSKLSNCSDISGEKYWRIPHFDEFREFIKSDIADLHNTSTGGAGGICAGLFLDEFKEDKPFIHLDVAGMTFTKKKKNGYPKGGTGYGVKTVYHYIKGGNNNE